MNRTVLAFPVLAGKTETDIRSISERFKAEPGAYVESRRRAGVTLERAYWQHTPMGDFVVAYTESEGPASAVIGAYARSTAELDRFFVAAVKDVHGIDVTALPDGPPPETVGEWVDPAVTERRRGMAFCAPIVPEHEHRGRTWAKETFGQEEMTQSRRALGQNLEVVTVTPTPAGPVAAVYLEGIDPFESNRNFATSAEPFNVRFRDELKILFPSFVDFDQPVQGITEIFDSLTLPRGA
jgi:hypothetical protein